MATRKSDIITELKADASNFTRGINKAKGEAQAFKGTMDKMTGSFKSAIGGLGIPLGVAGITAGLVSAARGAFQYAEEIENAAIATGLSEKQIQLLGNAATASGVPISFLQQQLVKLNEMVHTEDGQKQLKSIGINVKDTTALIQELSEKMKNATSKDLAEMTDVFSAKFMNLSPMFKGWEGFDKEENKGEWVDNTKLKEAEARLDRLIIKAREYRATLFVNLLGGNEKDDITGLTNDKWQNKDANPFMSNEFDKMTNDQIQKEIQDSFATTMKKYNSKDRIPDLSTGISKSEFVENESQAYLKEIKAIRDNLEAKAKHLEGVYGSQIGGNDPYSAFASGGISESKYNKDKKLFDMLWKNINAMVAGGLEMDGNKETYIGNIYDAAIKAESELTKVKIEKARKILELGESEENTNNNIFALKERIIKIQNALTSGEDDVLKRAEYHVKLKRTQKDLEEAITSEKQKQNDETIKNMQAAEKASLEQFKYLEKMDELELAKQKAMRGEGMYSLPSVDEYRKLGKSVGMDGNYKLDSDIEISKKQLEELKEINENIANLNRSSAYN